MKLEPLTSVVESLADLSKVTAKLAHVIFARTLAQTMQRNRLVSYFAFDTAIKDPECWEVRAFYAN
jgi:hypothetical protein